MGQVVQGEVYEWVVHTGTGGTNSLTSRVSMYSSVYWVYMQALISFDGRECQRVDSSADCNELECAEGMSC